MLKLEIKTANLKNVMKNVEEENIKKIDKDFLRKTMRSLTCKVHRKNPIIRRKGNSLKNLEFSIESCCADFKKIVQKKLKHK